MFGFFKQRKPATMSPEIQEYILAELRRMNTAIETQNRLLDKCMDMVTEHLEGEEDLGTVSGASGAFAVHQDDE